MNAEAKPKQYSVMRHSRPALIVGSLLFCFGVNYLYTGCKPAWQFDRQEPRARQVITGAQLQNWATNLIASHPNKSISFRLEDLGTNFPAQLRNLAPKLGPRIYLYEGRGENEPPSIRIYWGSG